jgi:DNA-binding NtrC family response regulator
MQSDARTKVLVIDDDDSVRESFRNYLEDNDYIIYEATNGRQGLELFATEKPDVVLVDLRMPELDGLQVLGKITTASPDTPIIVISATGLIGDAVEAMHLGTWDYLLKPVIDLAILRNSITKALERARLKIRSREHVIALQRQVNALLIELGREPKFPSPDTVEEDPSPLD